jgi:regulation of enolase protein 1 (concanavalin A-like superfamily)
MADDPLRWFNPPPACSIEPGRIEIVTGDRTDFWRNTFYGFCRDNGHFLYRPVVGDFSAEVHVSGEFGELYDQAGLMARISETHWLKCGIELSDGIHALSVVVTNQNSDWSLVEMPITDAGVRLRLTRHGEAMRMQYYDTTRDLWKMLRLAYLPPQPSIDIGVMACSPQRSGFRALLQGFQVTDPIDRELHG